MNELNKETNKKVVKSKTNVSLREGQNARILSPKSILSKFSSVANQVPIGAAKSSKGPKKLPKGTLINGVVKELSGKAPEKEAIETKFITKLMRKGKKEKAEITLLKALKKVEQEVIKKESSKKEKESSSNNEKVLGKGKLAQKKGAVEKEGVVVNQRKKQGKLAIEKPSGKNLGKILEKIIENAKPLVRLKKVRIAGATHQKPVALTRKQAETDAIKRIIINAKARSEKSSTLKLAKEFEEIYLNVMSNKTLTEVREFHKLAEANKANITLK